MARKVDVLEQLTAIERVGPSRAEKLYSAGVRSVLDVSLMDAESLADAMDCSTSVAKLVRGTAVEMIVKDRAKSSTPGLLGTGEKPSVENVPDIPPLPPIPEPDPVIKVPYAEKMTMLNGPGKRGMGRGPLFDVLVCRGCFVIKAAPNPKIKEKRARYAPLQGGLAATNLVCDCKTRGTYNLQRDDRPPGCADNIAKNPRNNIVFSQHRQL